MNRRIVGLAASNFLAPLLQFAASPILTRIYGPEAMGGFAVAYSIAMLLALVFTGQVHQALVSENDPAGAESLYQEVMLTALLMYGLAASTVYFAFGYASFPVLCLGFFTALGQILAYYLSRNGKLRVISLLLFARATVIVCAQIVFGKLSPSWESLLLGTVCAEACFILGALLSLAFRDAKASSQHLLDRLRFAGIRRHRNYPLRYLPSQLISLSTNFAPLALAAQAGATGSAGLFAFSLRLVQAPAASITNAVRMTFWRPGSSPKDIHNAARRITRWGQPLVALGGATALLLPESLYAFVFGPKWGGISLMLASVFLWQGSSVVTQFAAEVLKHTGKQGAILRAEVLGSLFKCVSLVGIFLEITTTTALASFAFVGFVFNLVAANYYLRVSARDTFSP